MKKLLFIFTLLIFVGCGTESESEIYCSDARFVNNQMDYYEWLPFEQGFWFTWEDKDRFVDFDENLTTSKIYIIRFTSDYDIVSYEEAVITGNGTVNGCD